MAILRSSDGKFYDVADDQLDDKMIPAEEIKQKPILQLRTYSKPKWHIDEVFVKIKGDRHYLWWAVDYEGALLDNLHKPFRKKERATLLLLSDVLLSPC